MTAVTTRPSEVPFREEPSEREVGAWPLPAPSPLPAPLPGTTYGVTRRRRGRRRQALWVRVMIRAGIIALLALAILLAWQGVAHSQAPGSSSASQDPADIFGWGRSAPTTGLAGMSREEYLQQLIESRHRAAIENGSPTPDGVSGAATESGATPSIAGAAPAPVLAGQGSGTEAGGPAAQQGTPIDMHDWIRQLASRWQRVDGVLVRASAPLAPVADASPNTGAAPPRTGATARPTPASTAGSGAEGGSPTPPAQRQPSGPGVTPDAGRSDHPPPLAAPPLAAPPPTGRSGHPEGPEPPALGALRDEELTYRSTLDLALALDAEFGPLVGASADVRALRHDLQHHLIDLSMVVGHTDNPRANLDAVRQYLQSVLRLEAREETLPELERLLPARVLHQRLASPLGFSLIALAFSERLNPYLDLEGVQAGGVLGLRYRSGAHRYILVPLYPDRLHTDREFVTLALGPEAAFEPDPIQTLTRRQVWGLIFCEAGAALARRSDQQASAAYWVERGLALHPEQALGHLARAQLLIERNDRPQARTALARALALEPDNVLARERRAELLSDPADEPELIEDLRWLSRSGKHPRAALRLTRLFLARKMFLAARQELEFLVGQELPPSLRAELPSLRTEVEAAPWIEVLRGERPDQERFEAVDRLRTLDHPGVLAALASALEDENLRLSRYAWRALTELTGLDLPPETDRWQRALGLPATGPTR